MSRPNRFIAFVDIDGAVEECHVKNTGRCRELLVPSAKVYLQEFHSSKRRTRYDLIAVQKGDRLINIDSQAPNKAAAEWLPNWFSNCRLIQPEALFGRSRFDFYIETDYKKIFVEVKGVTLEENGVVLFPDAPTERGLKHILELCSAVQQGYEAYVLFVVQMQNVRCFQPNEKMHKAFAEALRHAEQCGVHILAVDCIVTPDSMQINQEIPVDLEHCE